MKRNIVLSACGRDRIGVADELNAMLASRGIEIEESRWTTLKGQFALMVELRGEPNDLQRLERDLPDLGARLGFELQLKPIAPETGPEVAPQFVIECYCSGPSGLSAVTGILKRHDINIRDMETEGAAMPWTSAITFHMKARLSIPPNCARDRLREELRELERTRNIDIVIRPALMPAHELA